MKTNKKATLGMLVALVISLAAMANLNQQKNVPENSLVWAAMTAYGGGEATPGQNFAAGAVGSAFSSMSGLFAGAAFGGPAGLAVGLGVGL